MPTGHLRVFRQHVGALFEAGQQLREGNAESLGDLDEVGEAEVGLPPFDGPHERPMDTAEIGESFLRVSSLQPKLSDSLPQGY